MKDQLQYIRDAIAKDGRGAQVQVTRWEKDPKTGFQDKPFHITVTASIALSILEKPLNKRSRTWQMIRPYGNAPSYMQSNIQPIDQNSLSNPDLLMQLANNPDLMKQLRAMEKESKKSADNITTEQ
jgi:hypothetical protein